MRLAKPYMDLARHHIRFGPFDKWTDHGHGLIDDSGIAESPGREPIFVPDPLCLFPGELRRALLAAT
jgi:hypothetical protein